MEIEIITMNTVEEYLNGMAQCEDWMSYRLAKVYVSGHPNPTLAGVIKYVDIHDNNGYLKTDRRHSDEELNSFKLWNAEIVKELHIRCDFPIEDHRYDAVANGVFVPPAKHKVFTQHYLNICDEIINNVYNEVNQQSYQEAIASWYNR